MTEFIKLNEETLETTVKGKVFKRDLIHEKETIEARLVVLKDMLSSLDK
jgi:hypothetical protein